MASLGVLKLVDGWGVGWELSKVEGGEAGRLMEAALELRICMVTGCAEVRTVINHKFGVRGHGTGILLHCGFQFADIVLQDGVSKHGG